MWIIDHTVKFYYKWSIFDSHAIQSRQCEGHLCCLGALPADIWGGCGVAWQGWPCTCLHLIMFYWTKRWAVSSSTAPRTARELRAWELLDWVNHSPLNGEVVWAVHNPGQRLASSNPDKLIGSRRGEGTPWPPYTLIQGEVVGGGYTPKNTAADAIRHPAINQNYLGMRCTS